MFRYCYWTLADDQDQQVQEADRPTLGGEWEEVVQGGRCQDQGDQEDNHVHDVHDVDAAKIKVIQEDEDVHDDCGGAGYERGGSRASDWTILRHWRQPNGE